MVAMSAETESALERGRAAASRSAWREAFDALRTAEAEAPLDLDDLEHLALGAYLIGEEDVASDAWTRAHNTALATGQPARGARDALMQASALFFRGDMAPAMGWIQRGKRVLDELDEECAEHALLLILTNLPVMLGGDPASAAPNFAEAIRIGRRFDDRTAYAIGSLGLGQCEIMLGRVGEGLALLDEAMASVTSGEVSPVYAGIAYCATIATCQGIYDVRRAREWTTALTRWCESQQGLVPFHGNCLVHRCEIYTLQGAWADALETARLAFDMLTGPPPWDTLGFAAYQLGEVQRLRGDLEAADEAYRLANRHGHQPEPGMSLLRTAQGRTAEAVTSITRVLDETDDRTRFLPSAIEILLAAGDVTRARSSADELRQIADTNGALMLRGMADQAQGTVLLAGGDARAALPILRDALTTWRSLDVPRETARTRMQIGLAYRALGDEPAANLEFDAARDALIDLQAAGDVAALDAARGRSAAPGGLTQREVEVLRLVAAGKTNRAVASELVLSEKTVARHVANIFNKLGVSSRAAATAYAYEHGLVST